jgi:hypothetical protein
MKFFIDTEFCEGAQKKRFGQTKPTIDLISIGVVCEDGREYYAISKDFNLKEAWNRYQIVETSNNDGTRNHPRKIYWLRDNVLIPIYYEMLCKDFENVCAAESMQTDKIEDVLTKFKDAITIETLRSGLNKKGYKNFEWFIKKYGKNNKQIAKEVCRFIDQRYFDDKNKDRGFIYPASPEVYPDEVYTTDVEFYGYYSDYDWVVFCWLFGKMIDLPKGFPMYCRDLKQMLDESLEPLSNNDFFTAFHIEKQMTLKEKLKEIKKHTQYPEQENEHNALSDARWNKKLYEYIISVLKTKSK